MARIFPLVIAAVAIIAAGYIAVTLFAPPVDDTTDIILGEDGSATGDTSGMPPTDTPTGTTPAPPPAAPLLGVYSLEARVGYADGSEERLTGTQGLSVAVRNGKAISYFGYVGSFTPTNKTLEVPAGVWADAKASTLRVQVAFEGSSTIVTVRYYTWGFVTCIKASTCVVASQSVLASDLFGSLGSGDYEVRFTMKLVFRYPNNGTTTPTFYIAGPNPAVSSAPSAPGFTLLANDRRVGVWTKV